MQMRNFKNSLSLPYAKLKCIFFKYFNDLKDLEYGSWISVWISVEWTIPIHTEIYYQKYIIFHESSEWIIILRFQPGTIRPFLNAYKLVQWDNFVMVQDEFI